ncbi:thiamine pyrophosphate-binding protein [Aureimonas fodinaquatilis]|uniref:Thiamine pyrophosphate-binding protein n=1 Tax=Aureimonas fodinaquatilis TaxID=2565783 RepID=A0A5B0E108_9HYPH|nr:thiamine pyrophosphate-binding protein [Aureimonas fodinaquatilis]KAA0971641.1 thiamine pyrophosphate-binding protein [Aureimonas fodinaquatilis]
MHTTRTGAKYIADYFKQREVTHVFFMDAILRRALIEMEDVGITRVLAHSEAAAAYMADGYARVSGRPGICMAQSVGAANLAAGLQDAYLHRSPVLAITGRKPPGYRNRHAYQEIDHAPLYQPVTKFHADVEDPAELRLMLDQAFRAMTSGAPRPAHLDLTGLQGELVETADINDTLDIDPRYNKVPAFRPPASADDIHHMAEMFAASCRPMLVAGAGAMHSKAARAIAEFAERYSIPVATSTGGHGCLPTDHPLHVGIVGNYSSPPANYLLDRADLVIFVGSEVSDQTTMDWTIPGLEVPKIQIDIDPAEAGRNYPAIYAVAADPRDTIEALQKAMADQQRYTSWADEVRSAVSQWQKAADELADSQAVPIGAQALCKAVGDALPDNAILVGDTGFSAIWSGNAIALRGAGQTYLRAAGSLGWAFPAALGAQCAAPERPVICFTGDGALYYHIAELETARRRNLPVVVVVNNNSAFGQALGNVRRLLGERDGNIDEMIRFGPTNFADVAQAFGVDAIRVERPGDLANAIGKAIAMRRPVLVDAVTDMESKVPEPWRRTR